MKPDCETCDGRGWVVSRDDGAGTATRCQDCLPTVEERLILAGVPPQYRDYTEQAWRKWRGRMPEKLAEWDGVKPLLIWGDTGTGKTSLAITLLCRYVSRNRPGVFFDTSDLLEQIKASWNDGDRGAELRLRSRLETSGMLVLDDLGQEPETDWSTSVIARFIRYRVMHGLRLIGTTNINLEDEQQVDRLGPSVLSRFGTGVLLKLDGADYRMKGKV